MLKRVLIANRGEIASRVIHVARSLGIETVAVYSQADAHMPFVRLADEAYEIKDTPSQGAYMRGEEICEVALRVGACALHPGYGFLSERAEFARLCEQAGLIFIGPHSSVIERLGFKDDAKREAASISIPVIEGYYGTNQEREYLLKEGRNLGPPLMIKPVAGGGGRGMRRVENLSSFEEALESAQRESLSVFGDSRVLLERLLKDPRHIECQILGDHYGHILHLFERDCSLQRRHQKVMEEAPAPHLSMRTRKALGEAAVALAKHVGYVGAGTVEFLVDSYEDERFYFMEMNTRLQVEHPITEEVTGLNLIEWQLRIAGGEPLTLKQEDIVLKGCAIEARLYAEDPNHNFLPSTGTIGVLNLPHGSSIRVDTGVETGSVISECYDPMVAKIIAKGDTRQDALNRLEQALEATVVLGIETNRHFLKALVQDFRVQKGGVDIGFIDQNMEALCPSISEVHPFLIEKAVSVLLEEEKRVLCSKDQQSPWSIHDGFSLMESALSYGDFLINGVEKRVVLRWNRDQLIGLKSHDAIAESAECIHIWLDSKNHTVFAEGYGSSIRVKRILHPALDRKTFLQAQDSSSFVEAPLHGRLLALLVHEGGFVDRGQPLVVLEAMKMEHTLVAPCSGSVRYGIVSIGACVSQGMRLAEIIP